MSCQRNCQRNCCGSFDLLISAVLAAAAGALFYYGLLINVVAALWIILGIGLLLFLLSVIGMFVAFHFDYGDVSRCICEYGEQLIAASAGTALAALATIAVTPVYLPGVLFRAILFAVTIFFLILAIIKAAQLICCVKTEECPRRGA